MEHNSIEKIRALVMKIKSGPGKRVRYPEIVKSAAKQCLQDGIPIHELCAGTGIGRSTLLLWSKKKRRRSFRRIPVRSELRPSATIRLTLPSGVSIECPSVEVLKDVLEMVA